MPLPVRTPDYTLTPSQFPVFLDANDDEVVSIMTISRSLQTGGKNTGTPLDKSDILHLVNPDFNLTTLSDSPSSFQICHSWAKDEEGDSARLVKIDFDSLIFQRAHTDYFVYTGYLTSMAFYAPGEDNIFTTAMKKEVTTEEYYANWEYPYLPPQVSIHKINFPIKVEITIDFGTSAYMEKRRNELRNQ
jgi:hypothetical protein